MEKEINYQEKITSIISTKTAVNFISFLSSAKKYLNFFVRKNVNKIIYSIQDKINNNLPVCYNQDFLHLCLDTLEQILNTTIDMMKVIYLYSKEEGSDIIEIYLEALDFHRMLSSAEIDFKNEEIKTEKEKFHSLLWNFSIGTRIENFIFVPITWYNL